jgi:hypothetical protein
MKFAGVCEKSQATVKSNTVPQYEKNFLSVASYFTDCEARQSCSFLICQHAATFRVPRAADPLLPNSAFCKAPRLIYSEHFKSVRA